MKEKIRSLMDQGVQFIDPEHVYRIQRFCRILISEMRSLAMRLKLIQARLLRVK